MKFTKSTFLLALIGLFISTFQTSAQTPVTGTWKTEKSKDSDGVHISFRSNEYGKHGGNIIGSTLKFERLAGLSPAQVSATNAPVSFSVTSEAGYIDMTGTFSNGQGSGTFTFTPDSGFVSQATSLGLGEVDSNRLFAAAVLDVKLQTARDLKSSGLEGIDFEDLFKATIFKIDSAYMNDMSNAGFENLDMEDLVKGRIFKIDADYARQVNTMGFGNRSLEELVRFRIFKITPEFLSEMRAEGFSQLTPEQVVKLRIFKIDSEFINEARAKGNANPTVEELVQLRIRGKID